MSLQERILKVESLDLFDYVDVIPELRVLAEYSQTKKETVLVHTNLVMKKSLQLCQNISNIEEKINLYLAALLHDFGKPYTIQKNITGQMITYNHEQIGVIYARDFLRKYFPQYGFARREYILSLVEYHKHPERMIQYNSNDLRFKQLSLEVDTSQIYNLGVANWSVKSDNISKLKYLEKFKERCQNLNIFGTYWTVPNTIHLKQNVYNLIRWNILFNKVNENDSKKIENLVKLSQSSFALLLMCGIPGSGKTTYIKKFYPHIERICPEDEKAKFKNIDSECVNKWVDQICKDKLQQSMQAKQSVIIDDVNITRAKRKQYIQIARRYGAMVGIVYFDLPLHVVIQRNQNISKDVIEQYYYKCQIPKPYEYDQLIVVNEHSNV